MHKPRILIIEDQLIVAEDLASQLEESGYEVIGISDTGEEAVKIALQALPDLVLVDIQLRGAMDGIEAAQVIRSHLDSAIVFLTAHSAKGLFERAKETEPDGYLYKPVSPMELSRTVEIGLFKKGMERRLRESEEKYRTLVETIPHGIVETDTLGTITFANEGYCRMLGFTTEEIQGKSLLDLLPSESEREDVRAYIEYLLREQPQTIPWLGDHLTKDGTLIRVRSEGNYKRNGQGQVIGFIAIVTDITERWKAEEALRQSEEEFRRIIENLQDPFYRADMNGILTFLSPASERVAGYKPEEGVGHPITMFYADPSERQEFMKLIMKNGFVNDFEARLVHKDGHIVWVSTSARLYKDKDGRIVGVEGIARDISDHKLMEAALSESEQMFRLLSEQSLVTIAILQDGVFRYVNQAASNLLEYPVEEILSWPRDQFLNVVHPEDRSLVYQQARLKQEGEPKQLVGYSFRIITKSGINKWVEIYSKTVEVKGSPANLITMLDITDRKGVEEALRYSEEKFRLIFQFSPLGVFHFDSTGTITACNDRFVSIIGSSREKLVGLNTIRNLRDISMIASIKDALSGGLGHYEDSYTSVTAQKTTPVKCEFAPILSADGTVLGGIGIVEDVSERKVAEAALQRSEHLYRSVIENIEDVFYRSDAEGKLFMASPSGARLFGYDRVNEMIGLPLESLWVNPQERRRLLDIVREQGKVTDFEGVLRKKDGSTFVASLSTHFYRDEDGAVLGTEGIVRDISERKRIESNLLQSQKMQAMGTLAGGVAHEINNLLQVVLGHADMLLLREGMDEKSGRSLEAICRAARNGAYLVNRILAFSRKTKPEMKPTNLSEEVRRLEELLRSTIPRMISLEMSLEENLRMISADPAQIEQILLNLAANARDAMAEGGRLVFETRNATIRERYCRTHPEVKPGKYVLLTVSDTGQGMEKGISDRIFEPFFTTKKPGKGTGLGLSTVFGAVKKHGGHVTCLSEPGAGSTFKKFFPVLAEPLQPDLATTIEMPAGGTDTLLLVDDEDAVRTLGAEMLELAGYTVLTASNGREAMEVYRNNRDSISLVILDLVMPEMSGRKCLEELLKINPDVNVLIASGFSVNGPAKEARESGAVGFLSKPFDLKQILLAIRKCLDSV